MSGIAVVTGANRGIGLEVVRQLAQRGFTTVLGSRTTTLGEDAARRLAEEGLEVLPRRLDITDQTTIDTLVAEIDDSYGHLDVLVNNAAIHYDTYQRASTADLGIVREALETNLIGAWRMCVAFIPLLRGSDHPRVVNVSSGAGTLEKMGGGTPAYKVSKTSLNALTLMLADELRRDGVLVNAVCPGWVATDMGGPGGRPVQAGAASVVWAVDLDDEGPTGGFFRDGRPIPW